MIFFRQFEYIHQSNQSKMFKSTMNFILLRRHYFSRKLVPENLPVDDKNNDVAANQLPRIGQL